MDAWVSMYNMKDKAEMNTKEEMIAEIGVVVVGTRVMGPMLWAARVVLRVGVGIVAGHTTRTNARRAKGRDQEVREKGAARRMVKAREARQAARDLREGVGTAVGRTTRPTAPRAKPKVKAYRRTL